MQYLESLKGHIPDEISTAVSSITNYIYNNKTKCVLYGVPAWFCARYVYYKVSNKLNRLPPGPVGWPLIGSLYYSNIHPMDWEYYLACTYGVVSSYKIFGTNFILISDAKIAKKIISRKDVMDRFYKPGQFHIHGVGKENTVSLIWIDGKDWTRRRRLIQNTMIKLLTNSKVNQIVGSRINDTLKPYLDEICSKNEAWTNPREMIEYLTFNSIYGSCFGESVEITDSKYKNIEHAISNTMKLTLSDIKFRVLPFMKYIKAKEYKSMIEFREWRNDFFKELLFQRKDKYDKQNLTSIVDHFYDLMDRNEMTLNECVADLFILFLAGMDTTTNSIEFGVNLIAKHPKIQETIRNELVAVFGKSGDIDLKKINQCPLLRAFIFETLRISAVVRAGFPHRSKNDQVIEDNDGNKYIAPKGSVIQYNIDYIQRRDSNATWTGIGDKICLENWLKKDEKQQYYFQLNESFINFGNGRRDCIGKSLAIKELLLVLGSLILNYNLSVNDINAEIKRVSVRSVMQIESEAINIKKVNI